MKYLCSVIILLLCSLTGCASSEEILSETSTITSLSEPIPYVPTVIPESINDVSNLTATPIEPSTELPMVTESPMPILDTEAPVLTLQGESYVEIIARSVYEEIGYVAVDAIDGDLTEQVVVDGAVDINLCGTYILKYKVSDKTGNQASVERTIVVKQPETVIPEGKIIYLTFDDGPGKYTDETLEILRKYGIKATFFTCGNGKSDMVTKIYEEGHTLGIHCRNHDYTVIYANEEAYFEDLYAMQDLIYDCTGIRTTLVRFPGGSSNRVSEFNPGIMTRLTEQLDLQGFQYFDWNVSSGDSGTKDTEKILNNLIKGVEKHRWSVVLQHPEVKEYSMKALERFIIWALENEYTFLTLDNTSPGAHHSVNN